MILTFVLMRIIDGLVYARWWWSSFMDDLSPLQYYQNVPPGFKGEIFDIYTLEGEVIRTGKRIFRRTKMELTTFGFYVITFSIFVSIFVLYYNIELNYLNFYKDYLII